METPAAPEPPRAPESEPRLSLGARLVAVFVRPADAWSGLRQQVQWWFPLLLIGLAAAAFAALLHHRAFVPMVVETWQEQVANGNMQADQMAKMEEFFTGPTGLMMSVLQQFIVVPVITLVMALLIWFGVGFIMGRAMSYRLSLEVAAWAGLVTIPMQVVTGIVAWTRETMKGVHVGFGLLLPETETPTRLGIFLGGILDAIGPLSLWYLAVLVLGAAAVSGAPRKQTALVVGGVYMAAMILLVGLGSMFAPVS